MMKFDLEKEEVIKCFHCGNETPMSQIGKYSWGSRDIEFADFDYLYEYELFACPVCHKVTLRESYGDETMIVPHLDGAMRYHCDKTILFPTNSIDSNSIPSKVKEAYEAALKVKNIDKYVGLLALRRTLELVLKDKGATKWGLKDKIEEIAEKGVLPDTLKEASSLTKILGDSAAHDKEMDIEQQDVESMAEFVEYIIEYLYVVPDKINSYKQRLSSKTERSE
ncbi:DUF4145 domain-containing protein [Extibacter muris]|uniref:DUF4145 domain-containing protein n=1 Tax=Extibacter muris TaxID=1796622 RepID=A0A4R4F944_9FIRM|nr:DUF4145 domain-containing protein [Extibacter muris]MCU0081388.1 DUF4145 domain-containing protein [Extibacter muris]TDA20105.1 DUF4145 domain-containing protein [Extibacter muris]